MKLKEIIAELDVLNVIGNTDIEIKAIDIDSRKVAGGHLFVALKGTQVDGHTYVQKAIESGATAILQSENLPENPTKGVVYLQVADTEKAIGIAATAFYHYPSKKLHLIGVTGTNGKTTIATVLYNLFRAFGHRVGLISTVCNYIDDKSLPSTHTTPDAIALNSLLQKMVDAGCEYAFMECSSHAIHQHRIGGLEFEGAIFTNLTRDHLDYHGTFEKYRDAKKMFFDELGKEAFALVNIDDRNGAFMTQNTKARVRTYSLRTLADYKVRIEEESLEGMLLNINDCEVSVPFIGRFNAANLIAVYGAAIELGKRSEETLRVLSALRPVNGRFEAIRSPKGVCAIVDYAHTPDALINVLDTINEIVRHRHRVICVCGAGGNRDKGKRPIMAAEAAKRSDLLILTSDNPRNEEPEAIINDMRKGLSSDTDDKTFAITSRKDAIRMAVKLAHAGDVILVAGKGHENYQEIQGVRHHFDDHEEVRQAFGLTLTNSKTSF